MEEKARVARIGGVPISASIDRTGDDTAEESIDRSGVDTVEASMGYAEAIASLGRNWIL